MSERKYDEDLGRVARFTCDLDALKKSIASFGQGELDGSRGGAEVSVTPLLALLSPKPFTCAPKPDSGRTGSVLLWAFCFLWAMEKRTSPLAAAADASPLARGACARSLCCRVLVPVSCWSPCTIHMTKASSCWKKLCCPFEPLALAVSTLHPGSAVAGRVWRPEGERSGSCLQKTHFGVFLFQFPIQRTATPPDRGAAPSWLCP